MLKHISGSDVLGLLKISSRAKKAQKIYIEFFLLIATYNLNST